MSNDKIDLRIGELLIEAGILNGKELSEAMKTARLTGLPVGRVLIMAGYVSEQEFQSSVQAQSLVRDGIVPLETAVAALTLLSDAEISFDEALKKVGWKQTEDKESNKLGELLIASEIVPHENLETAMRTSQATGLPLGRLLVSLGTISDELLATALNAQTFIRNSKLTRSQAIGGLKAAHQRRMPIEMSLSEQGYYRSPHRTAIRLGELLIGADLVSELAMIDGLQKALIEHKYIGQVLVESGLIDNELLHSALSLQEMVANETLKPEEAADTLKQIDHTDEPISQLIAFLEVPEEEFKTRVRYHEVLRVAGLIGQKDIDELAEIINRAEIASSRDAINVGKHLLEKGLLDERTFHGSLRCYFLIAAGWLNMQQGIIALNYFHHRGVEFDDVLHELKWTVRTYLKSELEQRSTAKTS